MLETITRGSLIDHVLASAPFTQRNLELEVSQPLVLSLGPPNIDGVPKYPHPILVEHKKRKPRDSNDAVKDLLSSTRVKDEEMPRCSQFSYFTRVGMTDGFYKPQLTSLCVLETSSEVVPGDIFGLDTSGKYTDPSHALIAKYRVMYDLRTRLLDITLRAVFAVEQSPSDPLVEICVDTVVEENRVYKLLFGRTKNGDILAAGLDDAERSSLSGNYARMEKIASDCCIKFVRLDFNPSISNVNKYDISPYNCYAIMKNKKGGSFQLVAVDDLFFISDGEINTFKFSTDQYDFVFPADGGYYNILGMSTMVKDSIIALVDVYARGGNSAKTDHEFAVLTPNEILRDLLYQRADSCSAHVSAIHNAENFNFATSPDDEPYILYGNENKVILARLER